MSDAVTKKSAASRRGRPPTGRALSAAERMRSYRTRHREAGLRVVSRLEPRARVLPAGAISHRVLEARSLAMHCIAALKIERKPALLKVVRKTLAAWRERHAAAPPRALDEWWDMLGRPWPEIAAFMTDAGEYATRLRQSSPFTCVLSAGERERVYAAFRT